MNAPGAAAPGAGFVAEALSPDFGFYLRAGRLLAERQLLAAGPARPTQFWTSASPEHMRNILPLLWNKSGVVRSFGL